METIEGNIFDEEFKKYFDMPPELIQNLSKDIIQDLNIRNEILINVLKNNTKIEMFITKKSNPNEIKDANFQKVYRLSVIDAFVEKAISVLEKEANRYKNIGRTLLFFCGFACYLWCLYIIFTTHENRIHQRLPLS